MPGKLFQLKEMIINEIPEGELPWGILGRISLKAGFLVGIITERTPEDPIKLQKMKEAAEDIFGKRFFIY